MQFPWRRRQGLVGPESEPRRVVVLVGHEPIRNANRLADLHPGAIVHVVARTMPGVRATRRAQPNVIVDVGRSVDEIHVRLAGAPRPQLLVDATGDAPRTVLKRLEELLYVLDDGGTYVIERPWRLGHAGGALDKKILTYASRLAVESRRLAAGRRARWRPRDGPAASVTNVRIDASRVELVKCGHHLAKLHDSTASSVLTARFGDRWGVDLDVRPASVFRSRAKVSANHRRLAHKLLPTFDIPELHLREYRDVTCAPRQLTVLDDLILPSSFHHPSVQRLRTRAALNPSAHHAALRTPFEQPMPMLDGTYFHLDSEFPGHFGHFFTEDIAKLWGWHAATRRDPDVRLLMGADDDHDVPTSFQCEALAALGISEKLITVIGRPTHVERLVTASQMFHNGQVLYVDPQVDEVWTRLRDGLRSPEAPTFERIFVTRTGPKRSCRNSDEVVAVFASHGFEIVRPELLPLGDQAAMFASARVVAGFAGSGMFNTIYSTEPGVRIVIGAESYTARNEYLISAVKGDQFHYFWCPPLDQTWSSGSASGAFHFDYEFDFRRDGAELERLVAAC